jgi:hypothetical protein
MIFSGWKRSATWRAKRRITRMGMSAPRYQRGTFGDAEVGRFFAMSSFYPEGCAPLPHGKRQKG